MSWEPFFNQRKDVMNLENDTNGYQGEGARVPRWRALQPASAARLRATGGSAAEALPVLTLCPVSRSPPPPGARLLENAKGWGRVSTCL